MRRLARPLLFVGIMVVVVGLALVHARYIGHYSFTGTSRFAWTFAYVALLGIAAYASGLPDLPRTRFQALPYALVATAGGALAISALQLFVGDALLPRFVVFGAAVILPDWYVLCVRLAAGGRSREEERARVGLVASRDEVAALEREFTGNPERPASLVLSLSVEEAGAGQTEPTALIDRARDARVTVLVLDRAAQSDAAVVAQAAVLHEAGTRIRTLSLFYEEWLGKLPLSELERVSLLFDIGEVHRARYGRAKRLLDVSMALAGVVVLALATPFVVLGNAFANRGPLLYRQERVGKGGRTFTILKFRTMTPGLTPEPAGDWTAEQDPRVTRFGRVLRKSHLDELPQVLNILAGDLSVVGPRPEQPRYVEELSQKLAFYRLRHLVRPGLTGWAQVKYGYAGSAADALEKLQYEFFYLRRQGLRLDARVIVRTLRSVFGVEGGGR